MAALAKPNQLDERDRIPRSQPRAARRQVFGAAVHERYHQESNPLYTLSLPRADHAPDRQLFASASLGDVFPSPRLHLTSQQAPRLAIFFEHSLASVAVIEVNRRPRSKRFYGNHI